MFNIEFYLSNRETQYLLCYNHHNILLSSGDAKQWLEKYPEQVKLYNIKNQTKYTIKSKTVINLDDRL